MKIIDQTPFQNDKGEIGIFERLQGTLKYGLSWYPELQAQKTILSGIDRILQGFTIIRNHTLDASGIVLPLIVMGRSGIVVAYVTHLRGTYMAKGDSWRILRGNNFQDTPINLLTRANRMARALNVFLDRQGVKRSLTIEPVILCADPGLYVETQRPIVRVVLSDGLDRWATSLVNAPPLISELNVEELAERILNPKTPRRKPATEDGSEPFETPSDTHPESEPDVSSLDDELEPSRAQAIFRAAEEAESFDAKDLGFAFEDEQSGLEIPRELLESSPEIPVPSGGEKKGVFGLTRPQIMILAGILFVEILVLAGFAAVFLLYF